MRRREFILLVGGAAVMRLLTARAQVDRVRRIGVLMGYAESDREGQANIAALRGGSRSSGGWRGVTSGSTLVGRRPTRI